MDQFETQVVSSGSKISNKPQLSRHGPARKDVRHGGRDRGETRIAHTLTACCRCRNRKTRCDPGLPRCGPCERSNATCDYLDTTKGKIISRSYVIHLQDKVQKLEEELAKLSHDSHEPPDPEATMRSAGYVRFKEHDEPRILGPSSGIGMTRLVMALAKQNNHTQSIKDIIPETTARQIKDRFTQEEQKPTSKVYPLISDVAAPQLPSRELTNSLVESFNAGPQYLLPTLHEPSFWGVVDDVYRGDADPYKNFVLRMVIAISMQKLSAQYAGLADSYYLASLPFLERTIRSMNLGTLQALVLVAQYSLVTPTRTAAYWVVGFATRLCQEMGITEEATILTSNSVSSQLTALQIDMRRRLYWIITSMEFGLAHSLGRPSSATAYDHIDVAFFEPVDDTNITPSGIIPGSPLSNKKLLAIHFFKMRLLQAEIRRKLYLKKRPEPKDDQDPWFVRMEAKIKAWLDACPKHPEGSGLNEPWFKARVSSLSEFFLLRFNTIVIFLHRPSPQIPSPSVRSAHQIFDAAVSNIRIQKVQIDAEPVVTWIWTQSLFLALNTTLFCLSYPDIRKNHPREEVELHMHAARSAIVLASRRWPGVESALELYDNLIAACLRVYDENEEAAETSKSLSTEQSPTSYVQEARSPSSQPSPFTSSLSSAARHDRLPPRSSPGTQYTDAEKHQQHKRSPDSEPESFLSTSDPSIGSFEYDYFPEYQNEQFDPASLYNSFPPLLPSAIQPDAILYPDYDSYPGPIGEQYSQYLHAPYVPQQPLQALSQEEQMELMQNLETAGLGKR